MRDRLLSLLLLGACQSLFSCGSNPTVYWNPEKDNGGNGGAAGHANGTGGTDIDVSNGGVSGSSDTAQAVCGNGDLEPGELCDDGGTEDGDGCSGDCVEQDEDFACLVPGEACVKVVICGSGVIEGDEVCDDGNTESGDGCSGDCSALEEGWVCPRPGRDCVESPECGNGLLERGEDCDDNNVDSGDGCTGTEEGTDTACQLENGFWCPGAGAECVELVCGDGNRTSEESCDDENTEDGDGCSSTCTVEDGWRCSTTSCSPVCGDGILAGGENCDDGNRESGDGCSVACTVEPFFECDDGAPSSCETTIECGNGEVEPGEICDPPGEDGCLQGCEEFSVETSIASVCGNELIEAGESCDPRGAGCSDTCQTLEGYTCPRPGTCMLIPECGDGLKQLGEECDVGPTPSEGCVDCQITEGWTCSGIEPSVCAYWTCGDTIRQRGEECDDGNAETGDGCAACSVEPGWHCSTTGCSPLCGDGILLDGEDCDDGNRVSGDGCSAGCFEEPFFVCENEPSECSTTIVCGNSTVDPGEVCDGEESCDADCLGFTSSIEDAPVCPNNRVQAGEECDWDPAVLTTGLTGCTDDCQLEEGYICPRPGVCYLEPVCGNGDRETGEECDDGMQCTSGADCVNDAGCPDGETCAVRDSDGCSAACAVEEAAEGTWVCSGEPSECELWRCGDGERTPGEECDDGNTATGDGCLACAAELGWRCSSTACRPICGDGIVVGNEECDDSPPAEDGDGCSAMCRIEPFYTCDSDPGPASDCTSEIVCGDGDLDPGERCEPSLLEGCSADCMSFDPPPPEPAVCGNGAIELGEECDWDPVAQPTGVPGCDITTCQVDEALYTCPRVGVCYPLPVCGNGLREMGEQCDDNNTTASPVDGCNAACQVDSGWYCQGTPSTCTHPVCGNSIREYGEQCDDGNTVANPADGCTAACVVEAGWVCPDEGEPCWPICGDGVVVGSEQCDYGNGCSTRVQCAVDGDCGAGETCDGNRCFTADSCEIDSDCVAGATCEPRPGDGCNQACRLEFGWSCPTPGQPCVQSACGNNNTEPGETCDDGNLIAGDGCGPTCQAEPAIDSGPTPAVTTRCGDGMVTGTEECDDGNAESADGCSGTESANAADHCQTEAGFSCSEATTFPDSIQFQVNYRDFHQRLNSGDNNPYPGGHPHMKKSGATPPATNTDRGIAGEVCDTANTASCGRLDDYGRPSIDPDVTDANIASLHPTLNSHPDAFSLWYRGEDLTVDAIPGANGTIVVADCLDNPACVDTNGDSISALTLERDGTTSAYYYDNIEDPDNANGFWPLDGLLLNNTPGTNPSHNFHFTTELRYFFQYQGGESLIFRGDDDVFVYVNGRLAVDIGGIHQWQYGRVILGDDGIGLDDSPIAGQDSNCTVDGGDLAALPDCTLDLAELEDSEAVPNRDDRFELVRGNVYEIVLFHAERHPTESNFRLTLDGFLAPRSFCEPICGDGIVVGSEVCDDGAEGYDDGNLAEYNSDTLYGACNTTCTGRAFCGDNVIQGPGSIPVAGTEICDNGLNIDQYSTGAPGECGPGCQLPAARCGDGILQQDEEECDNGGGNSDSAYGPTACRSGCTYGPYCGDGLPNGTTDHPEACDRGALNGVYGPDATACTYDCRPGPYCGDGVRNGTEQCDDGQNSQDPTGETDGCSNACTIVSYCGDGVEDPGEECDYGDFASATAYGGCTEDCVRGPYCGDGIPDAQYEECDLGTTGNTGAYDGCSANCTLGPNCGDGIQNGAEACDNGFNDDTYSTGADGECADGCVLPTSRCGDGIVDGMFEQCDNGDSAVNPTNPNSADAYGPTACTEACQYAPYCGDGTENGTTEHPELCDLGQNNGVWSESAATSCSYDCQEGPHCGDGIRNGEEQCDSDAEWCVNCAIQGFCGDGLVDETEEACDYGPFGSQPDEFGVYEYGSCTTECEWGPHCGDGQQNLPYEECDRGEADNTGAYNGCTEDCTYGPRCGDGVPQADQGEACDNGFNDDTYRTGAEGECGAGCQLPADYCGDGNLDPAYEECDNGGENSNTAYGLLACTSVCTFGAYCGDGHVNGTEVCDLGAQNGQGYGPGTCSYDCQEGPRCGDGVRNGDEQCDGTPHCTAACALEPYCGDGVEDSGEDCDYGQFASSEVYGGCTAQCQWGRRCGDGTVDAPFEQCDDGPDNDNALYGGCTTSCNYGPRCGDGVPQPENGEACDNGFNDDIYAFDENACGQRCQLPPSCGDGTVQASFELCDEGEDNSDTAYDGCSSTCAWGPYCGDGITNGSETCDDGARNTAYSAVGEGCSYDCGPVPYCGDGVRNGPEECDDGEDENVGGYGNCNGDCTLAPYCGDEHLDPGEECDDGVIGSVSCSTECERRVVAY